MAKEDIFGGAFMRGGYLVVLVVLSLKMIPNISFKEQKWLALQKR